MAWVICGRITDFRCLSSVSRASAPRLVIGYFMSNSVVQVLQAEYCPLRTELQCHADGLATGQGGGGVHLVLQRVATIGIGVGHGLATLGGVDLQQDLVDLYPLD